MEHDKKADKEESLTAEEIALIERMDRVLPPIEIESMASIPGQGPRRRKGPRRNIEWSEELGCFVRKKYKQA